MIQNPMMPYEDCCAPKNSGSTAAVWYLQNWFLGVAFIAILWLASFFWTWALPIRHTLLDYFHRMAVPLLVGLILGGLIEHYIPKDYITALLGRPRKRSILYAVSLGFFMSVCSHGILALSIQLYKKGAPTAVIVSFLLASPWANLPITLLLFSLFGLKALWIIVTAICIALSTGLAFQRLERWGWVEVNPHKTSTSNNFSIPVDLTRRLSNQVWSLARLRMDVKGVLRAMKNLATMVVGWLLIGAGIAALLTALVPITFFHQYLSASLTGLLMTLAMATVIEVCSEGMAPMAFEIFRQTGAFGNAFVFLMAGVVTDYTEIALLWANIGRRTALWLPLLTVPQVVLFGFLMNRYVL